jgi:large subunit ribosomal protein L17
MPHRLAGRRLGRASDHRLHMLDNLAVSVLRYEKVRTTEAKAKEVRGRVDHMITCRRGDLRPVAAASQCTSPSSSTS